MDLLAAAEQLEAVRLLKLSFVAYPLVNALHIAAIGMLLTSVLLLDLAVLGLSGRLGAGGVPEALRRLALFAFALAAVTGAALFSVQATSYARNPAFLLKLGLIALAAANFVAFRLVERRAGAAGAKAVLRVAAGASIVLWCGVLLCGRFIAFV